MDGGYLSETSKTKLPNYQPGVTTGKYPIFFERANKWNLFVVRSEIREGVRDSDRDSLHFAEGYSRTCEIRTEIRRATLARARFETEIQYRARFVTAKVNRESLVSILALITVIRITRLRPCPTERVPLFDGARSTKACEIRDRDSMNEIQSVRDSGSFGTEIRRAKFRAWEYSRSVQQTGSQFLLRF